MKRRFDSIPGYPISQCLAISLAIIEQLEEDEPSLSEEDVPEAEEADERDGALFDSARDYLEQNDVYQAHKGNGGDEDI